MTRKPKVRVDIVGLHRWGLCPTCDDYYVMLNDDDEKVGICPKCDGNFSNANPRR